MTHLDRHNRTLSIEEHARLSWRADCPICRRTRLGGPPPDAQVVSSRAKAALAAAVATGAGVLPAAPASAQAPVGPAPTDLVPPEPAGPVDESADSPSGASPAAAAPTKAFPDADAPLADDDDARAGGTVETPSTAGHPLGSSPPVPRDPAERQAGSPAATVRPPERRADEQGGTDIRRSGPAVESEQAASSGERSHPGSAVPRGQHSAFSLEGRRGESPRAGRRPAGLSRSEQSSLGDAGRQERGRVGEASSDTYVVQAGDSLWLIAERQLDAGQSDAAIAATVSRLWERNAHRIATGNPDLIHPGQRLYVEGAVPHKQA